MGKQLCFYQLQEDAIQLYLDLSKDDIVFYNHSGILLGEVADIDFDGSSGQEFYFGPFHIAYKKSDFDNSQGKIYKYPGFYNQLIEFVPSRLSMDKPNFYNEGRIYIADELYNNQDMMKLYNKLIRYVKKYYVYSKTHYAYYAPNFYERAIKGEVVPCILDRPYYDLKI